MRSFKNCALLALLQVLSFGYSFGQISYQRINGQTVIVPDLPLGSFRMFGAAPGQIPCAQSDGNFRPCSSGAGSPGPQGPQGVPGPQGPQGPQGFAGGGGAGGGISLGQLAAALSVPMAYAKGSSVTFGVGAAGLPLNGATLNGYTFVATSPTPTPTAGYLESITTAAASTSGPLVIVVLSGSVPNWTITQRIFLQPTSTAEQTYTSADFGLVSIPAGSYFGVVATGSNAGIQWNPAAAGGPNMYYFSGDPGSAQVAYSGGNAQIDLAAVVRSLPTPPQTAATVQAAITSNLSGYTPKSSGPTLLWHDGFGGSSIAANWVANAGSWTANNGLVSPASGQGYGTYIALQRQYVSERRTHILTFTPLTAGTVLAFGSVPFDAVGPSFTSTVTVDGAAGTINILNAGAPGVNTGVLASAPLGFTLTANSIYDLRLTLDRRNLTARITDRASGLTASVTFGDNAGSVYTPSGGLMDYPAITAIAGQFKALNFAVYANQVRTHVQFLGDSISYGIYVPDALRWTTLATAGTVSMASGRPGGFAYDALNLLTTETPYLKPDYLFLLIGTNDSASVQATPAYQANVSAIVANATAQNIPLIVAMIPPRDNGQATINTMNAFLKTLVGVTLVRFDLALSTGDGVTQNGSLFVDGTHPTPAGAAAMAARVALDAPFLTQ